MNEITITLTKSQVENLTEFFDLAFIRYIRERIEDAEDTLDNMAYLVDMCEIYSKLTLAEMALKYIGSSDVEVSSVEATTEPKKMTNFEKIKVMTPEELAEFMSAMNSSCDCCTRKECATCSDEILCSKHICEWLEEEIP